MSDELTPEQIAENIARLEAVDGAMLLTPKQDGLAVLRQLQAQAAELERLRSELALWKPLTPEEAEQAFATAEAAPLPPERIAEIVARATDPAVQLPNSEQDQLVVALRNAQAERDEARTLAASLRHDLRESCIRAVQAEAQRDAGLAREGGR